MAKKIRKRRANYFDVGGFSWKKGAGFKENISNAFNSGVLNSAIGATGVMLGQGISGGLSTGVGNVTQGLSTIASAIPGPWGAVAGAGLNVMGGLVNRLFGSQVNEQAVSNFRNQNTQMANTVLNADNYDSLLSQYSDVSLLGDISKSQVGKDGLFSNKAKNLTASLNRDRDFANERYLSSVRNSVDNIRTNEMLNANYAAYGGPLTMRYTGTMSPFGNTFANGGNIHIKPENRGKFTALKKRTGKSATWFKDHGTPAQRKMATFALNARKWKHEDGGPLNPYSAASLVDAIYSTFKREKYLGKPSHNYDFTISEEEADKLGYYPDERGHRDDRVKKPTHPTHPSRGKWKSFEEFELTDRGMENPNYTLFGLNDGGQDPQAVMTYNGGIVLPEITVTPKGSYIMNPYDNIKIFDKGGSLTNKKSSSGRFNNNYKEGEIYDVTEEEVKLLKELGYEFEYV